MDNEIQLIWHELDKQVNLLWGRWKVHNQLFTGQENVDLLNRSGSYVFSQLQRLITDNVFLCLSQLTDPARQGSYENTSISNLLEKIQGTVDDTSLEKFQGQLEELKTLCEKMKTHRNKRIAHRDINHAYEVEIDWLPPVTYCEIDEALTILCQMMGDIMLALFDLGRDNDPSFAYGCDGNHLLSILRKAQSGQTVRMLFLDGQERLFRNVSLDSETVGWLYVTRLDVDSAPLSGIVTPIAGYRLEALKGWEYVQDTGKDPLIDTSVSGYKR